MRATIILSVLTGIFFLIAFIAAVVAGSIYLARHVGAGPAALVVAGTAFLLGVIMLVALAIVKRPRVYAARPAVAPLTAAPLAAAPLALQSLLTLAIQARPYATLAVAVAAGFLATRVNTKSPSNFLATRQGKPRIQTMDARFFLCYPRRIDWLMASCATPPLFEQSDIESRRVRNFLKGN